MRKSLISTAVLVALSAPTLVLAEDAAPAAPAAPALMQGMNFPLSNNPNPLSVDAGPIGKVYVSGALSGLAFTQNHRGAASPAGVDVFNRDTKSGYGYIADEDVPAELRSNNGV